MSRILPLLTALVLALIVAGKLTRRDAAPAPAPVAASEPAPEAAAAGPRPAPLRSVQAGDPGPSASATPAIDQLVTLASRQRIDRERRYTYIDSLLLTSDSVVRRWPDRRGRPFRVALVDAPDLAGWRSALPTIARRALNAWQGVYPELGFELAPDPAEADITIRWIERFTIERTGQTDVQYLPVGTIQRAEIQLALTTHDGIPLRDEGLLAVAVHEIGHALGLPHSGNTGDVMYPDTRTAAISARDRATLVLMYAVAPGSLRLPP